MNLIFKQEAYDVIGAAFRARGRVVASGLSRRLGSWINFSDHLRPLSMHCRLVGCALIDSTLLMD